MNILIITESFSIGGLETNICGQVSELIKDGHSVYLASGNEIQQDFIPAGLTGTLFGLNLSNNVGPGEFIQSINRLREYVVDNEIDILHAQPFYSVIVSAIVAELEKKPLVLSLHGPAIFAKYHGAIFKFLLNTIIIPHVNNVFAVSSEVKELCLTFSTPSHIDILPNGINLKKFEIEKSIDAVEEKRWVCISRLDEYKIVGILEFIVYAHKINIPGVVIIGDGSAIDKLKHDLSILNLTEFVEFAGASPDIRTRIFEFAGIAGMGRVVLEGIAAGKKVILVGYDGVKTVITPEVLEKSARCNFSGRNFPNISVNTLADEISLVSKDTLTKCRNIIELQYNEEIIWREFSNSIRELSGCAFSSPGGFLSKIYNVMSSGDVFYNENDNIFYSTNSINAIGEIVSNMKLDAEIDRKFNFLFSRFYYEKQCNYFEVLHSKFEALCSNFDNFHINCEEKFTGLTDVFNNVNLCPAERYDNLLRLGSNIDSIANEIDYIKDETHKMGNDIVNIKERANNMENKIDEILKQRNGGLTRIFRSK